MCKDERVQTGVFACDEPGAECADRGGRREVAFFGVNVLVFGGGAQEVDENLYFGVVDGFGGECNDVGAALSQVLD